MNYRDIIREMKLNGHYFEAEDLERSVEHQGSTYDRIYSRDHARDGLSIMSYSGDCAEKAYDDIRYRERREEQEQEEARQREEARRYELERQRQEAYEIEQRERSQEEQAEEQVATHPDP